jgi:hypothetical protein
MGGCRSDMTHEDQHQPQLAKWKCLLCGRDKFTHKSPHYCADGYRKHKILWQQIEPEPQQNEILAFAEYLTGHDRETVKQMYNDYLKNKR